jgi:hypothetical protein
MSNLAVDVSIACCFMSHLETLLTDTSSLLCMQICIYGQSEGLRHCTARLHGTHKRLRMWDFQERTHAGAGTLLPVSHTLVVARTADVSKS